MRMPPLFFLALGLSALLILPACGGADGLGLPLGFPPTITSVSPAGGSTGGGVLMGVTGTNFPTLITVTVDGNICFNVNVTSSTTLNCIVPPGSPGPKDVKVATATGSATLPGAFTYIQTLTRSPGQAPGVRPLVDITFLDQDGAPVGLLADVLHQQGTAEVLCGDGPFSTFADLVEGYSSPEVTSPELYEAGGYYFGLEPESGTVFWYSDAASLALGAFPDGWCLDTRVVGAASIEILTP